MQDGRKYGFLDEETRSCETSDFSKDEVIWRLRSPGCDKFRTAAVFDFGDILSDGGAVYVQSRYGVRPALHLNLSSSNLFSYAGTVSSDGTKNEVPYNTRTRLVQK